MTTATAEKKALEKKLKKFSADELEATLNSERKRFALQSLYFHNRYVLGYADMTDRTHMPECNWLQYWPKGKSTKLFIAPRDTFKSSINTIGQSLWLIANDPSVKILITSETEGNAKKYLAEIQNQLSTNTVLQKTYDHLFRDYVFSTWNSVALNISPIKATDKIATGENTVDVAGIGAPKVGRHYDYVFLVDPHSENNVGTREQIEKVITYYRLLDNIKKTGTGKRIVEMTIWEYFDLANHIQTKEKEYVDTMIKSCYNEDGSLFFPERLSEEVLAQKRASLGSYLFSCNFLCKPQSDKEKIFKPEIARYYDELPKGLRKVLLLDPSISEKIGADTFAMLGLGVNRQTNVQYCLDKRAINRKMPAQAVSEIILFLDEHFADQERYEIAIETVSFQRIYKFELERELSKRGKPYVVHELKPGGRAKTQRIMGLQPFYENGQMLFRRGEHDAPSPDLDILMQFEKFPLGGGQDDMIDAWAYVLDLIKPKKDISVMKNNQGQFFGKQMKAARQGRQVALARRYS